MNIQVYNSLTKQKEVLQPLADRKIRMYSCGVTVYDRCHIGHARSLYVFDVIRKYLVARGYEVAFVRNITDIDDKIINKAREQGRTSREVSEENIRSYYEDLAALGIDRADIEPKATDNIDDMIRHIEGLIAKDLAYAVEGDVYFAVRKFPAYGRLSGQSPERMLEAVRIEPDTKKRDPLDFALWKRSKEGEPSWDSPWGAGRPGWHIECSCMSLKHLQCETLDIHAGGRDLIFPHHENEVAQAEALTGKPFARYWIHHGLLTINGQKMAKSLGNFITIQDALTRYAPDTLKMFFLSSHYTSAIDFSEERLTEAHKTLQRLEIFDQEARAMTAGDLTPADAALVEQARTALFAAMDDDFNTPRALAAIFELVTEAYKRKETQPALLPAANQLIRDFGGQVFGLWREAVGADQDAAEIEALVQQRAAARQARDFARADQLRDQLKERGIVIEDTPQGQRWRRQ